MSLVDDGWNYVSDSSQVDATAMGDWDYFELDKSATDGYAPGGSNSQRIFMVRWDRRLAFLNSLLGHSVNQAGLTTTGVSRSPDNGGSLPDQHPENQYFYCESAESEGVGPLSSTEIDDAGYITYTNAVIKANYKPVPYDVLDDDDTEENELYRFVERHYDFTIDYLSLPGGLYLNVNNQMQATGNPVLSGIGTPICQTQLTYIWHDVPADQDFPFDVPNIDTILSMAGKVNSQEFDGYDIGTVLFIGVSPTFQTPKLGNIGSDQDTDFYHWDLAFKFLVKDNGTAADGNTAGWNYFRNPADPSGKYYAAYSVTGNQPPFASADLTQLFVLTATT